MAEDLRCFARILFYSMLALIILPIFGSIVSGAIAYRVHSIESVIIAAFSAMGVLIGWIKSLEQFASAPRNAHAENGKAEP